MKSERERVDYVVGSVYPPFELSELMPFVDELNALVAKIPLSDKPHSTIAFIDDTVGVQVMGSREETDAEYEERSAIEKELGMPVDIDRTYFLDDETSSS